MFVILLLGLLGGLTEGAVLWRRQAFGNNSYPGQEIGNQINQQFGGGGFPQPPPQFGGFVPPNFQQFQQGGGGQQQGQQRLEGTSDSTPVPIVKLDIQPNLGDGKYQYSYETGNGIKAEESGSQKSVGEPAELGTAAVGSYSYTDPQGNLISLTYTADENGFVPQGDHLPVAPPIPPEILAALEKNAAEEAAQNSGAISPSYQYFFKTAYNTRHRYY